MSSIKILITTDNHLGYQEKNNSLKEDSFENFREALSHARTQQADFVFLLGDLFHDQVQSIHSFSKACQILIETTGVKNQLDYYY